MVPATSGISMAEADSKNGCCQCLNFQEEAQLPPPFPTCDPRLLSVSLSYGLCTFWSCIWFIHWVSLNAGALRVGFLLPTLLIGFLEILLIVFQVRCLGACLSSEGPKAWVVWCGNFQRKIMHLQDPPNNRVLWLGCAFSLVRPYFCLFYLS